MDKVVEVGQVLRYKVNTPETALVSTMHLLLEYADREMLTRYHCSWWRSS